MATYELHTDGACKGNPGPGGFAGIIIRDGCDRIYATGGDPKTTNNRMELAAVLEGLKVIADIEGENRPRVEVYSDSQYLTKAFNDRWLAGWQRNGWKTAQKKEVLNRDLWEALLEVTKKVDASFTWVRGHDGNPLNEEADRLAVRESQFARTCSDYWLSVGNPRSMVEDPSGLTEEGDNRPSSRQEVQEPAASPGISAEALFSAILDEAENASDFPDFKRRLAMLRNEIRP